MKSEINWQTGDALYEGMYLTTVRTHKGEIKVFPNYYYTCDGWVENDGEILAFCSCDEIKPYVESMFKVGEFVVENGVIGMITNVNENETLTVTGAAMMKMTFHKDMCRLATSEEVLSISARWHEQGFYYDIKKKSFWEFKKIE